MDLCPWGIWRILTKTSVNILYNFSDGRRVKAPCTSQGRSHLLSMRAMGEPAFYSTEALLIPHPSVGWPGRSFHHRQWMEIVSHNWCSGVDGFGGESVHFWKILLAHWGYCIILWVQQIALKTEKTIVSSSFGLKVTWNVKVKPLEPPG